jgi:hypothetical protein
MRRGLIQAHLAAQVGVSRIHSSSMQLIFRFRSRPTGAASHALLLLTFALAPIACTPAQKPVVSAAPPVASSTFEAFYSGTGSYSNQTLLRMVVGAGSSARELLGRNFTPIREGMSRSGPLEIPGSGELPLRVALVGATGDTLATVRVMLTLHPNWNYGVMAQAGGRRLEGMCIGRVTAAPIRPDGTDTLFVMADGLPKGAMC